MEQITSSVEPQRCWLFIALLGLLTVSGLVAAGFNIAWATTLPPIAGAAILHLVSRFYRTRRPEPRLAATCEALAQLILFTLIAGPLSYLAASLDRPLQDARLIRADLLLGFDWRAYLTAVDARPAFAEVLRIAYDTLLPQLAVAILILGLSGRLQRLRGLVWAVMAAGLVSIAVSAIWPAVGAYAHLGLHQAAYPHIQPSDAWGHVPDFLGVRDGSLRTIALDRMQGIIAFPSFHAALGILFAWAYCQHPATRWPGLAFEALVLLSTPIDGAHYLSDVIAGSIVALASIAVATRALARGGRRHATPSFVPATA